MSDRGFIDTIGLGVTLVAAWSIAGAIIALAYGDTHTAWLFLWAIAGAAATLVALQLFEERA